MRRPTSTPARACSPAGTWRDERHGAGGYYAFYYDSRQHETTAKEFTFPIYPDGSKTIPARSAADGMQDGIDLIDAVVRHPATGPRLARKLYAYFVNEVDPPDERLIADMASDYYSSGFEIKPMLIRLFASPQFVEPVELLQALLVAGGVRRPRDQGGRAGRGSR